MIFQDFPGPGIFKKKSRNPVGRPIHSRITFKLACSPTEHGLQVSLPICIHYFIAGTYTPATNCILPNPIKDLLVMKPTTSSRKICPCFWHFLAIAQFAITINSNVCPHIRVPNMLMRESYADVIGIFISEARY